MKVRRKFYFIFILVAGLFTMQGTLAEPMPREKQRTEQLVDIAHEQFVNLPKVHTPKRTYTVTKKVASKSFRKVIRHTMLGLLVVLALCGIPVMPPKKIEQDIDNEIKTEIVEAQEQKD